MVNINNTINEIFKSIKSSLPEILINKGLDDFQSYQIGYPHEQKRLNCAVRYAEHNVNFSEIEFVFIIHLQFADVLETDAYKYIDSVSEYLSNNFKLSGYTGFSYETVLQDDLEKGGLDAYFEITLKKEVDDCDM
ncbi:MAG: hypothetical protein FWC36_06380 [Spirochaetes bacterium]|nr:hypothetical protein [Spirochaetota bacterium]